MLIGHKPSLQAMTFGAGTFRIAVVALASVWLAACTAPRPRVEAPIDMPSATAARSPHAIAFEQQLEEKARLQDRQGRLAEEMTTLDLLALLGPTSDALAARRQALIDRIGTLTEDRLRRGAEALKKGLYDTATNQYLAALALSPENGTAASALRFIEKERNRRLLLAKQREQKATPPAGSGD
jgi:hypothetical protein